jgi:curved DNA-binding protein CbpA
MTSSPFEVLGLPPSLDADRIKRAYFEALKRSPPHADPEGFRAVRVAYERLSNPATLAVEYLSSPLDPPAERAAFEDIEKLLLERVEKARAEAERIRPAQELGEALSTLDLPQALSALGR